jgi:hypothetical protein
MSLISARSISLDSTFKVVYLFKVVAEYAESILTCTENSFKDFERIWRMCQEYFAKHGEYADKQKIEPTSVNFRPKQKKSDPKSPLTGDVSEWAKNHLTLLSL